MAGPGDDEAKQQMVYRTLMQTVGEKNFYFTIAAHQRNNFSDLQSTDGLQVTNELDDEYGDEYLDDDQDEMTFEGSVAQQLNDRE
ncbi:MAG: hypothetical protein NTW52_06005 [Planctomycetota bacterium]|nr:hypothetical protein [Planctomycetota bacterium]